MAVTPPSIKKSAPTTYAESSDARRSYIPPSDLDGRARFGTAKQRQSWLRARATRGVRTGHRATSPVSRCTRAPHIALPVVRMMKGAWPETAPALSLLFAVVMNAQLLLLNPFMPQTVRMSHLIETASSNFVFGLQSLRSACALLHRAAFDFTRPVAFPE